MKPRDLAAALGKQLQAFREEHALRQDEVALAARKAGLPWTRIVVRALETGRRELSIDEFARLPSVLRHLGAGEARSARLESETDKVALHVEPLPLIQRALEDPAKRRLWDSEWERLRQLLGPAPSGAGAGTAAAIAENQAVFASAGGDLEQKVARRARLHPLVVARAAYRLWGRSLTEERDARLAGQTAGPIAPRALQGARGHVTRALVAELEPRLAETRQRVRRKRGSRR
jgi:hypothetical protein